MSGFKKRDNISPLRRGVRVKYLERLPSFNLGYFLIIGFVIIFLARAVGVVNSNSERGGYAYVQMLNLSMPIVKTQVYKEDAYAENKLSVKGVVAETLGLSNINLIGIIANEINYFSEATINNPGASDHNKGFEKFQVNENTIAKLTPEEILELNDVSKAYKPSLKKTLNASKPEILIYHTHTMEQYAESGVAQTTNPDANVVGVGNILAKELEEGYGISVVHDKTNYSVSYNDAYDRSREGLQKYLSEYGGFKLIIDLHRDAVSNKDSVTTTLNGQSLSKFMFVTSQNVPTYDSNQKIVDKLYGIGSNLFPEIIKPTKIFEGLGGINGFNQGFAEGSMIIEVGAHTNAAQEAKLTGKYIARILAEYLNGSEQGR